MATYLGDREKMVVHVDSPAVYRCANPERIADEVCFETLKQAHAQGYVNCPDCDIESAESAS